MHPLLGGEGPPNGGREGICSRRGACPAGMHPPFSFPSCGKENGPCTVQKKRPLLVATLHIRAKLLYGSRRISACSDLGWPSGTLGSSAGSILPSRGGWRGGRRGARTHLICSSFRAFRFATRCPGRHRGCCVGPCCSSHQQPASGSENRRSMYPSLPRAKGFPKGRTFPSLTSTRECQPSPAGGRRSAPAQTDPPNIFSFPPGAAHFLFDVTKRGPRRAPRGGERRSKGAGAVFAAGGNGA